MIIGEIATDIADSYDVLTDGEYYVVVCEECKSMKVTPPTIEEWVEFQKFIRWHTEMLDRMMKGNKTN